MKCPKCGYISFDFNRTCPKCKKDLSAEQQKLNLPDFEPSVPFLLGALTSEARDSDSSLKIDLSQGTGFSAGDMNLVSLEELGHVDEEPLIELGRDDAEEDASFVESSEEPSLDLISDVEGQEEVELVSIENRVESSPSDHMDEELSLDLADDLSAEQEEEISLSADESPVGTDEQRYGDGDISLELEDLLEETGEGIETPAGSQASSLSFDPGGAMQESGESLSLETEASFEKGDVSGSSRKKEDFTLNLSDITIEEPGEERTAPEPAPGESEDTNPDTITFEAAGESDEIALEELGEDEEELLITEDLETSSDQIEIETDRGDKGEIEFDFPDLKIGEAGELEDVEGKPADDMVSFASIDLESLELEPPEDDKGS